MIMLDKVFRMGVLIDYYGALLTDKQQYCLEMHYLHDLSLAEIAEELQVSRQAIHDILRRAEQILIEYEDKLRLVERREQERLLLREIYDLLNGMPVNSVQQDYIRITLEKLHVLLD